MTGYHCMYLLLMVLGCMMLKVTATAKPNFVIMFMDDMGWGDLGCYGNPISETPNLDKMAAEGIRFTDFYTGSAICSPSRASLLTGRLPIRNGFYSTNTFARNSYAPQEVTGGIADSEILFPEVLKKGGYRNKIVGKWHLGHREQFLPLKHGFDEWFGAPNCHYRFDNVQAPNIPVYKDDMMQGRYYDDFKIDHNTGIADMTQLYIKEGLSFIDKQAASKEPFLLYWAPDATHTPLYASLKFRGKSRRGLYGDAVMEIDDGVGQILASLKQHGIENNTFVFFSSDNGAATYAYTNGGSNGPFLCGKQTTFEGGYRQPAIARWPSRIKPGQVSSHVGNLMDIYSTVLEIANLELPPNYTQDGESLTKTLFSGFQTDERPVFYYRGDTIFKVRFGQFKAHFYTWDTPAEAQPLGYHYCPGQYIKGVTTENMTNYTENPLLFDLGKDPGEKYPLWVGSEEFRTAMTYILKALSDHRRTLVKAEPAFNICNLATQNWRPNGCEKINRCLPAPPSKPYKCDWPW